MSTHVTLDNLPIDKRQGKSDIWVTKEPDNYQNGLKVVQKRENIAFNQAAASRVEKWNQHQDCSSFNDHLRLALQDVFRIISV